MKLSDIKGERTLDVIGECIGPIVSIAADSQAAALFQRQIMPEGMTSRQFAAQRLAQGLPPLLKGHKKEIIAILAAIQGISPQKYAKELNLGKLLSDLMELLTDQQLAGLFTWPGPKAGAESSGNALAATGGPVA